VSLNFVAAHTNAQSTFENVPSLIVTMVDVWRGDETRRAGLAALIAPFSDYKGAVRLPDDVARKRGRDDG